MRTYRINISKSAKAQKDNSTIPMIIGCLIIFAIIGCSIIAEVLHLI